MSETSFERLLAQMPQIADAVNKFENEEVQRNAFEALYRTFVGQTSVPLQRALPLSEQSPSLAVVEPANDDIEVAVTSGERKSVAGTPPRRRARKPAVRNVDAVRTLNLRPDDKQSFRDLAAEKRPGNNREKCTVAVYWLSEVAGLGSITAGHVMACYREMGWREPANLANALAVTASTEHWLDTRDMSAIKLTTPGRNLVKHDLPTSRTKK